jgi:hypothetical protein
MAQTRNITGMAPNEPRPTGVLVSAISALVKWNITNKSTKDPIISLVRLEKVFLIAGPVQNAASFSPLSSVAAK